MNTRQFFTLLFLLALAHALPAQIKGNVTDSAGEPLPFASVYVLGTTQGTTTNMKGEYFLELEDGTYQLVFQYIGYRQKIENVTVAGKPIRLNVALAQEAIQLLEVEVKANAEDPAYAIIRKAIAKRKFYKEQVKSYSCDVYIKGNVKVLDAPTKILGQDVGDLDGSLDTNRQGIVYLSESVSKLYFRQPDKFKEVMTSSKVSGNDNGFSFNSARDMNIDLYENFIQFGRNVISPIAEGAMGFYKYRLQGALVDEEGRLINKIEVIPKNPQEPVYQGFIYIVDGLWNIQSADLFLTGASIQQPLFDTFYIRQTHVPVQKPDVWRMFSQTFSLVGGAFGFKFGGSFTGVYTNYDLSPNLPDKFFDNEVMTVEKGANEKDTAYWSATRPVPLTLEEGKDYQKKDSLQVIRESKPYLDSMDRKNNKITFGKMLTGYTWQNSWKRRSFTVESPLQTGQFNNVQGYNLQFGLGYRKSFDKERLRNFEIKGRVNYGFAEEIIRLNGESTYSFNRKKFARIRLSGGREVAQFNTTNPVSWSLNTIYATTFRRNYARLYDRTFIDIQYRQEVSNGVLLVALADWAKRSPLENHSNYSFFYKKSREFALNVPDNQHIPENGLAESKAAMLGLSLRFRFSQKYMNYPNRKYILGSKFPDLWVHYRKGLPIENGTLSSNVDYDRLSAAISKSDIVLGLGGVSAFRFEAGTFLNNNTLYFQDFKYFNGNRTNLGNPERYLFSFKMLPYYEFSTRRSWVEGHYEHNFRGYLLDKIPGIKKLGLSMVAGAAYLYTPEEKNYWEISLGLDNIGLGIIKLLRFDVVSSFRNGNYQGTGFLIGVRLPGDEFSF
jgi:hypothetical protein